MKKLLLILSALIFITGCEVESASNNNEDTYPDDIELFFVDCTEFSSISEIRIDNYYNEKENNSYKYDTVWLMPQKRVSDTIKVDFDKLKIIKVSYTTKSSHGLNKSTYGNLDKSSFKNLKNGLYAAEFYGLKYDGISNLYLRKTISKDYYLNNEDFYKGKNIIFIKNNYKDKKTINVGYGKQDNYKNLHTYLIPYKKIRNFIIWNPAEAECITQDEKHHLVDYSILKFNDNELNLTKLKKGYYYSEIDSEGNFTTPVKLNSYKDIINN